VTDRFTALVAALPAGTGTTPSTASDLEKVRSASTSPSPHPEGSIQK